MTTRPTLHVPCDAQHLSECSRVSIGGRSLCTKHLGSARRKRGAARKADTPRPRTMAETVLSEDIVDVYNDPKHLEDITVRPRPETTDPLAAARSLAAERIARNAGAEPRPRLSAKLLESLGKSIGHAPAPASDPALLARLRDAVTR
jgi:hypothetical protein